MKMTSLFFPNQKKVFDIRWYGGSIVMNDTFLGPQRYIIVKPGCDAHVRASAWNGNSLVFFIDYTISNSTRIKYVRLSMDLQSVANIPANNIVLIISDSGGNIRSMSISELDQVQMVGRGYHK